VHETKLVRQRSVSCTTDRARQNRLECPPCFSGRYYHLLFREEAEESHGATANPAHLAAVAVDQAVATLSVRLYA
jgi:hypothetical protein